jgi:hypothetical protein
MLQLDDLVILLCDNAHEELGGDLASLHWSVGDPLTASPGSPAACSTHDERHHRGSSVLVITNTLRYSTRRGPTGTFTMALRNSVSRRHTAEEG